MQKNKNDHKRTMIEWHREPKKTALKLQPNSI